MADKANDTASRIKHATRSSFVRSVPDKHKFGTSDEIAARVGGTIQSLPDNNPSNFRQLGPDSAGGNYNERKPKGYSGNQKFGNPRRYS